MSILVELHQKRRNSLGETGGFKSEAFREFHHRIAERMLEQGKLWLHWMEYDGQPVAILYDLLGSKVVFGYSGGIDIQDDIRAPGKVLFLATLKAATERGFEAYDFLRGEEAYKFQWRATPRPAYRFEVVAARTSVRLRYQGREALQATKRRIRRQLFERLAPRPSLGVRDPTKR
jgi:CelD/BcsL family acetyltransferase involved in cellulose biosynthesis